MRGVHLHWKKNDGSPMLALPELVKGLMYLLLQTGAFIISGKVVSRLVLLKSYQQIKRIYLQKLEFMEAYLLRGTMQSRLQGVSIGTAKREGSV